MANKDNYNDHRLHTNQPVTYKGKEEVLGITFDILCREGIEYYTLPIEEEFEIDWHSQLDTIEVFQGSYDTNRFSPVKNNWWKPEGGIWTSPAIEGWHSEWIRFWAKNLGAALYTDIYTLTPKPGTKILVTLNRRISELPKNSSPNIPEFAGMYSTGVSLDFELLATKFDAVRMLFGANSWDLDSTVWFNQDCFDIILAERDLNMEQLELLIDIDKSLAQYDMYVEELYEQVNNYIITGVGFEQAKEAMFCIKGYLAGFLGIPEERREEVTILRPVPEQIIKERLINKLQNQ